MMMTYRELLERDGAPAGSSWGLFGEDDQLGTLNHLSKPDVAAAARLVRNGSVFNLDYPLNVFHPYPSGTRDRAEHNIFKQHPNHRDDYLDSFYLQSTSQIDGLRHIRHPQHGFYNATDDSEISEEGTTLGIHHWSEKGLVGRGVLLDVERHLFHRGSPIDQRSGEAIGLDTLLATAEAEEVEVRSGDMLLIRTGWTEHFLGLSAAEKKAFPQDIRCPGLEQSHELVGWLWDSRVSLLAADNFAVEALPAAPGSPFTYTHPETGEPLSPELEGKIHPQLIALLGMAIGEMWALNDLAQDCAADGVYEFMVVAEPMNVVGGVGSPSNAVAIK